MTDQVYDQLLTQLTRGYEFVMKDDRLDVQMRIKTIDTIP